MAVKKRLKKGMNYLSTAYYSGAIQYSRVDNSFVKPGFRMDTFPHPKITPISKKLEPIEEKKLFILKKENIPVFLSALGIVSPANIESVFLYIDYYLDDFLNPREGKKEEVEKIIKELDRGMKKEDVEDLELVRKKRDIYQEILRVSGGLRVYSVGSVSIKHDNEERTQKTKAIIKEKNKEYDTLSPTGCLMKVNCLMDAIRDFRESDVRNDEILNDNTRKRSKWA